MSEPTVVSIPHSMICQAGLSHGDLTTPLTAFTLRKATLPVDHQSASRLTIPVHRPRDSIDFCPASTHPNLLYLLDDTSPRLIACCMLPARPGVAPTWHRGAGQGPSTLSWTRHLETGSGLAVHRLLRKLFALAAPPPLPRPGFRCLPWMGEHPPAQYQTGPICGRSGGRLGAASDESFPPYPGTRPVLNVQQINWRSSFCPSADIKAGLLQRGLRY